MSSDDNMRDQLGWALTEVPEVRDVIRSAASSAGQKLGSLRSQYDSYDVNDKWAGSDLEQEAMILVATNPELQSYAEQPARLYRALVNDLLNMFETEVRRSKKSISYDAVVTSSEDFLEAYVAVDAPGRGYDRESVREALPAVWDESYCYGMDRRDNLPDPDMPRSKANPAHGNNLAAVIADIKTAWKKADLTIHERRALLLAYGFGWTQRQVAYNQGVSQQVVSQRAQNGIAKMVAHLNGGDWYEMESQEGARAA